MAGTCCKHLASHGVQFKALALNSQHLSQSQIWAALMLLRRLCAVAESLT
jgi:hypothetical protein